MIPVALFLASYKAHWAERIVGISRPGSTKTLLCPPAWWSVDGSLVYWTELQAVAYSSLVELTTSRWAQQLLKTYWLDTDIVVFDNIANDSMPYNVGRGIQQGVANFYRHHEQDDIGQLDFFDAWYEFTGLDDGTYYNGRHSVKEFIEEPDVAGTFGPPIWEQADKFAKSMYSAVMTDLGQTTVPNASNILTNPDVLRTYAERFSPLHKYVT